MSVAVAHRTNDIRRLCIWWGVQRERRSHPGGSFPCLSSLLTFLFRTCDFSFQRLFPHLKKGPPLHPPTLTVSNMTLAHHPFSNRHEPISIHSHFRPSHSPPMVPVLPPIHPSTCTTYISKPSSIPHVLTDLERETGQVSTGTVSARDTAFLTTHSRVLRASISLPSSRLHSIKSLVLQSPSAPLSFPS